MIYKQGVIMGDICVWIPSVFNLPGGDGNNIVPVIVAYVYAVTGDSELKLTGFVQNVES